MKNFKQRVEEAKYRVYGIRPTIGQFQKIVALEERTKDSTKPIDKLYKEAEFCAILEGVSKEKALQYNGIRIQKINKIYREPKPYHSVTTVPKRFLIGSRVFKTVPEFEKFSAGEMISLNQWTISDEVILENLHNLAALCSREYRFPWIKPRKENPKEFYKRAEYFKEKCPAEIASSLAGFFLRTQKEFLKTIPQVLRHQLTQKN